ncbi:MAG TPA: lysylphosphatidylglycerol synthase domain-containing protein [Pyrinomonadaceae bacterium]|jgi:hypothetical protein|nr:lysylphosphatidylglycerol synthase domain-containing protein [Pyrinomonadaceae bacterium]
MNESFETKDKRGRFTPVSIIFAVLGALLFAYFIKRAGVEQIFEGMKRLGAGFLLVFAISCVRLVVRALAWTRCCEAPHQLRFTDAAKARVMGDALGNLVPLGTVIVSEPSKAVLVRDRIPLMAALSSLAIENLFYSLSVALFIFCGTASLLLAFPLPKPLRYGSIGALVAVAVIIPAAFFVIRKQWKFASGALEYLYRRGVWKNVLEERRERVRHVEDRIYGFYARHRSRFLSIMLLEACFHLAGILEAYSVLYFISIGIAPTLFNAFVLESVNRVITVVFKFMPFRAGVGEGSTEWTATLLGFGKGIGTTLEIVRKARDLCWTALGFLLLLRRGLSARAVSIETARAVADVNKVGTRGAVPVKEEGIGAGG